MSAVTEYGVRFPSGRVWMAAPAAAGGAKVNPLEALEGMVTEGGGGMVSRIDGGEWISRELDDARREALELGLVPQRLARFEIVPPFGLVPIIVEESTMNSPQEPCVYIGFPGERETLTPAGARALGQALIDHANNADGNRVTAVERTPSDYTVHTFTATELMANHVHSGRDYASMAPDLEAAVQAVADDTGQSFETMWQTLLHDAAASR